MKCRDLSLHNSDLPLDRRSCELRLKIVDMVNHFRKGHIPSALSIVEILRVLYDDVLVYDPRNPKWAERDRFVLSKGHGCLALYVILAEKGFFPVEELSRVYSPGSFLGGHPERDKIPGVEVSTGSLGHGLSVSVGFALAARMDKRPTRVFAVLGDGECNEGSIWEAALCAAKHGLDRLCVLVDYNKLQSYGAVEEISGLAPLGDKWRSFGFSTREIDGHDPVALLRELRKLPFDAGKPSALICHTVKGKGISFMENNPQWHHQGQISDEEISRMRRELGGSDA